jgi:uncharacterized membrane protein YcaP (DUF421 family)
MWMEHMFEIIIRSVAAFGIMMVITRILGKPTISQMTYHDFVAAITLGALTANIAFNVKINVWQLLVSLITFSGIAYVLMILALKNRTLRKWISGKPTILIQDGKVLENNMRKLKITLDTLNQELREKNILNDIKKEWLLSQIKARGLSIENISYAVKSSIGHLIFDQYNDQIRHPIDKE